MPCAQPDFSIVMPAYNAAAFIVQSIESVLAQSLQSWELLVVDDGSTDTTAGVIGFYAARDPRIRLVRGMHRGCSAARNCGIALARGRYVAFLDADDVWLADKLQRQLRHFDSDPQLGMSFTRARYMTVDGEVTRTVSSAPTHGLGIADLLCENATTTPSTLAVRSALLATAGGFDESLAAAEDLEWIIRVLLTTGCRIEGIDAPLTLYRASPAGASSNLERQQAAWEKVMESVRASNPALHARHYRAARATHLRYLARQALRLRQGGSVARRYINAALAADWRLILRSPRRTLLTLAAAYCRWTMSRVAAVFA
jgi:glycosyltransferase involved in cell wall biosynthesis